MGEEEAVQLFPLQIRQCDLWLRQEVKQGVVKVAQQCLAGALQIGQVVLPEGEAFAHRPGSQPGQEDAQFLGHLRVVGKVQALAAQEAVQALAEDEADGKEGTQDLGFLLGQGQVHDDPLARGAVDQPVAHLEQTVLVAPEGQFGQVVQQGGVFLVRVKPEDGVVVLGAVKEGFKVISQGFNQHSCAP